MSFSAMIMWRPGFDSGFVEGAFEKLQDPDFEKLI